MYIPLLLFIVLLVIPVAQEKSASHLDISADERKALMALFEQTGGKDWKQKYGWLGPSGTECGWYGVRCAQQVGKQGYGPYTVTDLKLANNGLKGQIPPEIAALKNLRRLDLDGNAIKKPLPDDLLRVFDQGQLQIDPIALIHDLKEVEVEIENPSNLCFGLRVWISSSGNVLRESKKCRERKGQGAQEVYYESQTGKTINFDRLARSFVRSGLFSDAPLLKPDAFLVIGGSIWNDVTEIKVMAKRINDTTTDRLWRYPFSMTVWELEKQIHGVLAEVQWIGSPTIKNKIQDR